MNLLNLTNRISFIRSWISWSIISLFSDETVVLWFSSGWLTETQVIDAKNKGIPRPVQQGRCYNFDWVNDFVIYPALPTIKDDTDHTLYIVIKLEETWVARIFSNTISWSIRYWCSISNWILRVWFYNGISYSQLASCVYTSNDIEYIAITHTSDGVIKIYIDWVEQTTSTFSPNVSNAVGFFLSHNTTGWLLGNIYDLRVFDYILTTEEIQQLWHNQYTGTPILDIPCSEWEWVYSYSTTWSKWEIKNATLATFHSIDNNIRYSRYNMWGYTDHAWLILPLWQSLIKPNQNLAYKTNQWYLRTIDGTPSSYLTSTQAFVISSRVKVNKEWEHTAVANSVISLPYWYMQIRGIWQEITVRLDTLVSAKLSITNRTSWDRERVHILWYADPVTKSTKLYVNGVLADVDIRTLQAESIIFKQHDIYIWYLSWTHADLTIADVRIYWVSAVPTDTQASDVYNWTDPSWWAKYHHLSLDGTIEDTGTMSKIFVNEIAWEYVNVNKTYTGMVPLNLDLVQSECANFDWVNDYIDLPTTDDVWRPTQDFTFMMRTDSIAVVWSDNYLSISHSGTSWIYMWMNAWTTGKATISCEIKDWTNTIDITTKEMLTSNIASICLVFNNTTKELLVYVNGMIVWYSKNVLFTNINYSGNNIRLWDSANTIQWSVCDVRMYHATLTGSQIYSRHKQQQELPTAYLKVHYPMKWDANCVVGTYHWIPTNITSSSFRWWTQDVYHYWMQGNTEYLPTMTTKIKAPLCPELLNADETDDFRFTTGDVQNSIWYSDIVADVNDNHITMSDVSVANQKKNIVIYDTARTASTTPTLEEVQTLLNH